MESFCPQCSWGVEVDEDGCCVNCGATAIGDAINNAMITDSSLLAKYLAAEAEAEYYADRADQLAVVADALAAEIERLNNH